MPSAAAAAAAVADAALAFVESRRLTKLHPHPLHTISEAATDAGAADRAAAEAEAGAEPRAAAQAESEVEAAARAAGETVPGLAARIAGPVAGATALLWQAAERKVLTVRKPAFGLPTACPTCLPVLLYLRMANVPFDLVVDTSNPNADHIPYVEFGECVVYNNEEGGIIDFLRDRKVVDFNSNEPSVSPTMTVPTKSAAISTCLADAMNYELWVNNNDGSIANDIYYSDLPWPIRKMLYWKRVRDVKNQLGFNLKATTANFQHEIYRKANEVYDLLSKTLLNDATFLIDNRPTEVDALFLGHAFFVLSAMPDTSVLKCTLKKHQRLVRFAQHHMYNLLGIQPSGTLARTLPYVVYDQCVLGEQVHYEDCQDLSEYIEEHCMWIHQTALSVPDKNGFVLLPGREEAKLFRIATEECKKLIRTILKALALNESQNICFEDFTEENIAVTRSGKAKFKNITVIYCLCGSELLKRQRENYLCAWAIIRDLFKGATNHVVQYLVPDDIQHLLDLMENNFEDRNLFAVHGSLIPMALYSAAFLDMWDTIKCVLPYKDFWEILGGLPYVNDWKNLVKGNELLSIPFGRNPGNYEIPTGNIGQTNLNKDQKACLLELGKLAPGIDPPHGKIEFSEEEKNLIKGLKLFVFWRNSKSHRLEPFRSWIESHKPPYNVEGSNRTSYALFPMALVYLQWVLYQRREQLAGHLGYDVYF